MGALFSWMQPTSAVAKSMAVESTSSSLRGATALKSTLAIDPRVAEAKRRLAEKNIDFKRAAVSSKGIDFHEMDKKRDIEKDQEEKQENERWQQENKGWNGFSWSGAVEYQNDVMAELMNDQAYLTGAKASEDSEDSKDSKAQ